MKRKLIVTLVLWSMSTIAAAQTEQELCGPGGAMEQERERSINQAHKEIDEDPFFEQIGQQRNADRNCMLDLSKQLGGAVGADTAGLGGLIDQIFQQLGDAMCGPQGSVGGGGGTPNYTPSYAPPAPNMVAPSSQQPPATPSLLGPSSGSSGSSVWDRLSDAMGGRASN